MTSPITTTNVLIEGWLDVPHSYAIVNIYQILALLKVSSLKIYFKQVPKYNENWSTIDLNLLVTSQEKELLLNLECVDKNTRIDLVYRISFPINILHGNNDTKPTLVFYTSEFQNLPDSSFCFGYKSNKEVTFNDFLWCIKNRYIIPITPSVWSSMSLKRNGYDPIIIPHGVDVSKYNRNKDDTERVKMRELLGIDKDAFVFLNIGAATSNKNIKSIIKCFYKTSYINDNIYLVIKGVESLYSCEGRILGYIKELINEGSIDRSRWKYIRHRFKYIPDTYDYNEMRNLYNTCDCYISPYIAEGFNMPVLEAIACGIPVIVSKGGPTDDFTNDNFARYPQTVVMRNDLNQHLLITDDISIQNIMISIMTDKVFLDSVKYLGPEFIKQNYTWEHISERLSSLFLNIVNENEIIKTAKRYNLSTIKM